MRRAASDWFPPAQDTGTLLEVAVVMAVVVDEIVLRKKEDLSVRLMFIASIFHICIDSLKKKS